MSSRVSYANYVQKRQVIIQNEANLQNPYPPTNDAAIIPLLKFGAANTTGQEYEEYLAQVTKTVPGAPTILLVLGRDTELRVLFVGPANTGNTPITGYQYSIDAGATWISTGSTASPILIAGLTNDTTYSVTIRAVNVIGVSAASNSVSGTPAEPSDQIVSFTTVGAYTWTAPDDITSIEVLVVGGGGGSGPGYDNGGGGGGGGGEVLYQASYTVVPGTTYNGTVGAGGAAGTVDRTPPASETSGGSGGNSIFDTIVSPGGGGGFGSRSNAGVSGGGGTAANAPTPSTGGGGGGAGGGGGGGGGAQGNGGTKSDATPGSGGTGISSTITGSSVTYGRGGAGAAGSTRTIAIPGAPNTGFGASAGGNASSSQEQGAVGGSGIVVIKYSGYA